MTLDQIIKAEALGGRAIRAIRPFLDSGAEKDAMNRAELILAEARQFAVIWDDIRTREDSKETDADMATKQRQAAIQRLTTFVAPSRI